MATRSQRYEKTKIRHANRMVRWMKKHGVTSRGEFGGPLLPCPVWSLPAGEKQKTLELTSESKIEQRDPWPPSTPPYWTVTPATPGKFRILKILPASYPPGKTENYKSNRAKFDVHHRRRRIVPRKPDRLRGDDRKAFGSSLCHFLNGWFNDGDVLDRHPQETEVFRLDNPLEPDPPGSWD